jgi:hypothetical protein
LAATASLEYDSNLPSELVPPAQEQFYWKVFLFCFLYFRPLEDDLDLDEEVEEERRWRRY